MKYIKYLICMFIILSLCLCCCSCGFFGEQEYYCEPSNVKTASIIKLDEYITDEYRFDYTVLCEISDTLAFIENLNNISHSVNWGDPGTLEVGYIVIRIDYINGDYDLIHCNAQWFNRSGTNNNGYFFFDKQQFDALIKEYTH